MRLISFPLAVCCMVVFGCGRNSVPPAIPTDSVIEKKIDSLIRKMTLEEKIGQMTEITVGVVTDKSGISLSEEMLDTVIGKYKVGSILNIPFGVGQPKEVFAGVVRRIQEKSLDVIGIPCIYGLDQIHGASYTQGATFFPQGINMAATFNRGLAKRGGEITAYETRACLIPWTYAPVMDLGRDPRWPRMWESYGEDPYLNAEMAVSVVQGLQGEDPNHIGPYNIASCIKHYMGYGVPVSGKDRTPAVIAPNDLREKYFAPFKECIDAGALTLMVNSASINGIPCHCNRELLTGWLKEDLNWDGMIVTDYLVDNFEKILDYGFTADVEKDFDQVAEGNMAWNELIASFYAPFHKQVETVLNDHQYSHVSRELGHDPQDGKPIVAKYGQYGPYVQKGEGDDRQFASLGPGQLIESITLEEALRLFELPRTVGQYNGMDIICTKGRFGPYMKYGDRNISLPRGTDPLKVDLETCIGLIVQAENRPAKKILLDFPQSDIQVIDGNYGPYIKHAGQNYRIPKGTDTAALTEDACKEIVSSTKPTGRKARKK